MAGVKREEKNSQMKRNAASPQQHIKAHNSTDYIARDFVSC